MKYSWQIPWFVEMRGSSYVYFFLFFKPNKNLYRIFFRQRRIIIEYILPISTRKVIESSFEEGNDSTVVLVKMPGERIISVSKQRSRVIFLPNKNWLFVLSYVGYDSRLNKFSKIRLELFKTGEEDLLMYFNLVSLLPGKLNLCSRFNTLEWRRGNKLARSIYIYIDIYRREYREKFYCMLYIIFDVSSAIFRTAWDYVLNWEGRNERTSILAVTLDQLTRRRVYFPMLNQFDLTLAC